MEYNFQNESRYSKARKRVENIKGFYGHLISFGIINLSLFVINIITSPNYLFFGYWFYWNLLVWGLGLLLHGLIVFNYIPFFGKEWQGQKIKEFMDKEKETKGKWE